MLSLYRNNRNLLFAAPFLAASSLCPLPAAAGQPTVIVPWEVVIDENTKAYDRRIASFRIHGKTGVQSTIAARESMMHAMAQAGTPGPGGHGQGEFVKASYIVQPAHDHGYDCVAGGYLKLPGEVGPPDSCPTPRVDEEAAQGAEL